MGYIGIDLGTSAVKLLLMGEQGEIKRIVSEEYPLYFPKPGWSEQNPEDWYHAVIKGLLALLDGISKEEVKGISFGGQMHGLVILDEMDEVIRPAILWNDARTGEENDYLNHIIGKETLSEYTANISFAGFTASKLLWVRRNEPVNFNKIKKMMLPKDYLAYRLTGVHSTDVSDASGTLLFDVKNKCWSDEMLGICGIRKEQLPRVYESYEAIGCLKPGLKDDLGLSGKIVVAAGAGDNAAAAVGCKTVGVGGCTISLGTSGTVFITSDDFCIDPSHALHSFAHADGGYHLMGCMLSAASCNKWWMENILNSSSYEEEQDRITALGENEIYFLPYLMGERSPHNDPDARGMFIGMNLNTTRQEMTQAVLEGVAFGLRDSIEVARGLGIEIKSCRICGGGAKSRIWLRMIASILNTALELVETEEGPGYGAAILAAVSCSRFPSVKEAAGQLVKVKEVIEPEKELVLKYEKRYQKFRKIYPAAAGLFRI